jgi:hypothetical protein
MPSPWSGVDEADVELEGAAEDRGGCLLLDCLVHIAEPGGTDAEPGHRQRGPAQAD